MVSGFARCSITEKENLMLDPPDPPPVLTPEQEAAASFLCLVANLRRAKVTEEQAKKNRINLEELISKLVPTDEVGQKTVVASDGTKVTVKRGLSYKADFEKIDAVCIQAGEHPPVKSKTTRELDIQGYEWYRKEKPEVFQLIAGHVSVTPRKVSVTLKGS